MNKDWKNEIKETEAFVLCFKILMALTLIMMIVFSVLEFIY